MSGAEVDLNWRAGLVLLGGLVYWVGVFVLGKIIRKRIGRAPNLRPKGRRERLLWLGWITVAALWILVPAAILWQGGTSPFAPATSLLAPWNFIVGAALTLAGYAATLWCYAAMGSHWRIFIDHKEKNKLITEGPYRWIRHPIYAFQSLMLLGAVFLLPCPMMLAAFLLQLGFSVVKLRDEEVHLMQVHGDAYREYKSKTGSLTPWF